MPPESMTSLYAVVAVLTAAVISSTVALAPCDQNVVDLMKTKPDCYNNGNPPALKAPWTVGTHVAITKGELKDMKCVIAKVESEKFTLKVFGGSGSPHISSGMTQEPKTDHILETDAWGDKYKLYVTHNENSVFSFYRCADVPRGKKGYDYHLGEVLIDCKNRENGYEAVVKKAMRCFNLIGITHVEAISPCDTQQCD